MYPNVRAPLACALARAVVRYGATAVPGPSSALITMILAVGMAAHRRLQSADSAGRYAGTASCWGGRDALIASDGAAGGDTRSGASHPASTALTARQARANAVRCLEVRL